MDRRRTVNLYTHFSVPVPQRISGRRKCIYFLIWYFYVTYLHTSHLSVWLEGGRMLLLVDDAFDPIDIKGLTDLVATLMSSSGDIRVSNWGGKGSNNSS